MAVTKYCDPDSYHHPGLLVEDEGVGGDKVGWGLLPFLTPSEKVGQRRAAEWQPAAVEMAAIRVGVGLGWGGE